jgi:hypothetical protein
MRTGSGIVGLNCGSLDTAAHLMRRELVLYGTAVARVAARTKRAPVRREQRLVFVVGSPRSGTTFLGQTLGREPLSFENALAAEEERTRGEVERLVADPRAFSHAWWNWTYRARGLYAEQLERWYAVFPRGQLLVLSTDELGADPAGTYARALAFVGAPPHELDAYPRVFSREYEQMARETRAALAEGYREPNARLYELLGRDLGWG